ncbi:OmpA family protein [Nocardiopsis sp. CC223A]|uniref:OmpA family protein n=1 Tax=Nocardiopsis sp. CC223A TaxID=3044051 RepID=UPI00278C130F|nr:OmpA family protein [Nocardiopsis sp. CC223A]
MQKKLETTKGLPEKINYQPYARSTFGLFPKLMATSLAIFVSGCVVSSEEQSSGGDPETPSSQENTSPESPTGEDPLEPIGSSTTTTTILGGELQIDILALEALENDILRLSIRVTNNSGERFSLADGLSEMGDQNTASRISLIDANKQQRYLSHDLSNGRCFCSPAVPGSLDSGESAELWVAYPKPENIPKEMTVILPIAPPIFDVPVEESSESLQNEGVGEDKILDLTMISDNLEDHTGRTENSDEVSIILSSDVLFGTNSSTLSPKAREILEQVATEIDDASATIVSIDGYADNTGSDAVNVPLSEDRAAAVEEALSELVTRESVTFEVAGHGASDPIADNGTEEGRERNRRVSVTFEK